MRARWVDLSIGLDGRQRATFTVDGDLRESWDALHDRDVDIGLKRWRKKRSLDANAYAWVLIDKLACRLRMTKTEVYREMIRNIGGVSHTVCVEARAADELCAHWSTNGIGWFGEIFPSATGGYSNVILYYGSSTYDSKQMSDLIDLIVYACREQGIETATPAELARYKTEWRP